MSKRVKRSEELESEPTQCAICIEPESIHLVMCDLCDDWYHFHCAGVGPEVEDFDWLCRCCQNDDKKRKSDQSQG